MSHYLNLNLTIDATQDDIKRSYKELSLKYHPDKNPDGKEIFQEISKSYKILSDEHLRIIYNLGKLDQYMNIKDKLFEQLNDDIINNILNIVKEKNVILSIFLLNLEMIFIIKILIR